MNGGGGGGGADGRFQVFQPEIVNRRAVCKAALEYLLREDKGVLFLLLLLRDMNGSRLVVYHPQKNITDELDTVAGLDRRIFSCEGVVQGRSRSESCARQCEN